MNKLVLLIVLSATSLAAQQSATVLEAAAPPYPRTSSGYQIEGEVLVEIELSPDGKVVTAEARSGPPALRTAAERTAGRWRFAANGPLKTEVVFAFILLEGIDDPPAVASLFRSPSRIEIFAMKREAVVISDPPVGPIKKKRE